MIDASICLKDENLFSFGFGKGCIDRFKGTYSNSAKGMLIRPTPTEPLQFNEGLIDIPGDDLVVWQRIHRYGRLILNCLSSTNG